MGFQIFLSEPRFQKYRTAYFVPLTVLKDIVAGRETVAEKGTQGKSCMLSSKTLHGMGSEQCSGGIPGGNKWAACAGGVAVWSTPKLSRVAHSYSKHSSYAVEVMLPGQESKHPTWLSEPEFCQEEPTWPQRERRESHKSLGRWIETSEWSRHIFFFRKQYRQHYLKRSKILRNIVKVISDTP